MQRLFIILFLAVSGQIFGQGEAAFFAAFKNNDIPVIENYLEQQLDFCLFENQQYLSNKEVSAQLKKFLSSNKVVAVEVLHKGTSKNGNAQYKVAKLITANDTYRLFVFSSGAINAKSIKELRIDKF